MEAILVIIHAIACLLLFMTFCLALVLSRKAPACRCRGECPPQEGKTHE